MQWSFYDKYISEWQISSNRIYFQSHIYFTLLFFLTMKFIKKVILLTLVTIGFFSMVSAQSYPTIDQSPALRTKLDGIVMKLQTMNSNKQASIKTLLMKKSDSTTSSTLKEVISYLIAWLGDNQDSSSDASINDHGSYVVYSESAYNKALTDGKQAVLDFSAVRCPVCQALKKQIIANEDQLPANSIIFEVDYDTYDGLRQKYSVSRQTTFVFVDQDGNEIKKLLAPRLNGIISTLESLME